MNTHAFRLTSGQDLKRSIEKYVREKGIRAGYLLTCVGGLSQAVLRMPGAVDFVQLEEDLEIVSVQGTLSPAGCHLHASVSDKNGHVSGGHLSSGCIVRLTTEIALVSDPKYDFVRELDEETGYRELVVNDRKPSTGRPR